MNDIYICFLSKLYTYFHCSRYFCKDRSNTLFLFIRATSAKICIYTSGIEQSLYSHLGREEERGGESGGGYKGLFET